jgi:hypothetical protein
LRLAENYGCTRCALCFPGPLETGLSGFVHEGVLADHGKNYVLPGLLRLQITSDSSKADLVNYGINMKYMNKQILLLKKKSESTEMSLITERVFEALARIFTNVLNITENGLYMIFCLS